MDALVWGLTEVMENSRSAVWLESLKEQPSGHAVNGLAQLGYRR
jgi:hypothetical protein